MLPSLSKFFTKTESIQLKDQDSIELQFIYEANTITLRTHLIKDKN